MNSIHTTRFIFAAVGLSLLGAGAGVAASGDLSGIALTLGGVLATAGAIAHEDK